MAAGKAAQAVQATKSTKTGQASKSPPAAKAAAKTAPPAAPAPVAKNAAQAAGKSAAKTNARPASTAPASKAAGKTPSQPAPAPGGGAARPAPSAAPNVSRTNPPAGMPPGVPAGPARPATALRPSQASRSTAPAGAMGTAGLPPIAVAPSLTRPVSAPARPAPAAPRSSATPSRPGAGAGGQPRPPAPSTVPSVRLGTRVGTGKWTYEPVPDWGRTTAAGGVVEFGTVSGIACDSKDNVYVFQRTIEPCVLVFTPDGTFLRKFGADTFRNPHGIWIGPDATRRGEEVILLTDRDLHQVVKYTLEGRKLATWGAAYREPGDAGQPFNQPARATLGPRGEMYVADGYGQYRVHQFSPEGELVHSWGKRGKGPGEFGWPVHHALLDPRGRLIVSDRGNNRLQLFSPRGKYQGEWADIDMPQDYVITRESEIILCEGNAKRIAVLDLDGAVLARWGEGGNRPGQFAASPHSLWVDSRGDLYVGEVIDPNRLTKFVRR